MQKMHIWYISHTAIFLKNKNLPGFSWKKFVDSEFIPIFVASKLNLTYNDMNNMNELAIITTKDVEDKLIVLRSQEVLLDCDVAELYGVKTKEPKFRSTLV